MYVSVSASPCMYVYVVKPHHVQQKHFLWPAAEANNNNIISEHTIPKFIMLIKLLCVCYACIRLRIVSNVSLSSKNYKFGFLQPSKQ